MGTRTTSVRFCAVARCSGVEPVARVPRADGYVVLVIYRDGDGDKDVDV